MPDQPIAALITGSHDATVGLLWDELVRLPANLPPAQCRRAESLHCVP